MKIILISLSIILVTSCVKDHKDLSNISMLAGKKRKPAPTLAPSAPTTGTVDKSFFGLHILGPVENNVNGTGIATAWPEWNPSSLRLLNTYGYSSTQEKYVSLSWGDINTSKGVYDWSVFDRVIAKHSSKGVTDLIYTINYPPTWAGGGSKHDSPPNLQDLNDFIIAVANRAILKGLPIKYWEVWNEPNNGSGAWIGTFSQMVEIAHTVHTAAKSIDTSYKILSPSPQGYGTSWMDSYLSSGGGVYADIIAFHGYMGSNQPESISTLVDMYKSLLSKYGQDGKPLWNTEAMFWGSGENVAEQSRFLAVTYLLCLVKGVERYYWYSWDSDWGKEWTETNGRNSVGVANETIISWFLGASNLTLTVNDPFYQVDFTVADGCKKSVVWNKNGESIYATTYTNKMSLSGSTSVVSGNLIINQYPVLLY